MKRAVWWFPMATSAFTVDMPLGARVLGVRLRDDKPVIYAQVDPDAPVVAHRFATVMTGEVYDPPLGQWDYIGTVQVGWVVAHLFYAGGGAVPPETPKEHE